MKFLVKDTVHGDEREMSLKELLEEINRDRSDEWTNYDETDFREGLEQFTDYVILKETSE
jgi:hypothetical protein